jgi:hypothetical protein
MRLSIEPEMDNTRKEEKGRTGKYRIRKIKGEKNCMHHRRTLTLIIIKLYKHINYGENIFSHGIYLELNRPWFKIKEMFLMSISTSNRQNI